MSDQNKQYDPTAAGADATSVISQEQLTEAMPPVDTLDLVESLSSQISLDGHG